MKQIIFTLENDEGEELEYNLPAKYEVCHRCQGEGKHIDPNIDGNGITASEWNEIVHDDPDFAEDYKGGMYDVSCKECHGDRVVLEVDVKNLVHWQVDIYKKYCEKLASNSSEERSDRKLRELGY